MSSRKCRPFCLGLDVLTTLLHSCHCVPGDEVAKSVMTYAENESHNPTTQTSLVQFAANFAAVQDYRDAEVSDG